MISSLLIHLILSQYVCLWGQPCQPSSIITGPEQASVLVLYGDATDAGIPALNVTGGISTDSIDAGSILDNDWDIAGYKTSAAQGLTTGAETVINFDTISFDPNSLVTTGAGWVLTVRTPGYYLVTSSVNIQNATTTTLLTLDLYTGATQTRRLYLTNGLGVGSNVGLSGSTVIHANAGDTYQIKVFQNSGGTINLSPTASENFVQFTKIIGSN